MIRYTSGLVVILAVLLAAERIIGRRQQRLRTHQSTIVQIVPPRIEPRIVDIHFGGRQWRYVYHQGAWRYPAYHDAFADPARLEGLLRALRGCSGTPADGADEHGLADDRRVDVILRDVQGRAMVAVQVGDAVPGTGGRECYMRFADEDQVYHVHTNPRLPLGHPLRPLVDLRVLPAGLGLGPATAVTILPADGMPQLRLEQVFTGTPSPAGPPQRIWRLVTDTREEDGVDASVRAYVAYLRRLAFTRLQHPARFEVAEKPRMLILTDHTGRQDTLEVGARASDQDTWIRLRTTGHSGTITQAQAELLFPSAQALLDTAHTPARYQRPGE